MDAINQLWQHHLNEPYPDGYRGVDVVGIDLVMLDADIAGCVSTYLGKNGRLDLHRAAILGRCYRDVSLVVRELNGEARDYFARLERMAAKVLEELSVRSSTV